MINDHLNTAFPWYTRIEMQNRYKENCSVVCDFKLISRENNIPPFIIGQEAGEDSPSVTSWKLYCSDGTLYLDLDSSIGSLQLISASGRYWIIFTPEDSLATPLECGSYYSTITTTDDITFYSEVFTVVDFADDSPSPNVTTIPNFSGWRFYDSINKQNRYKGNCQAICPYYLISNNNSLLPFQFKTEFNAVSVSSFVLRSIDESCEVVLDNSLIEIVSLSEKHIIYNGDLIEDLPCGIFYAIVTVTNPGSDEMSFYSEIINLVVIEGADSPTNYILQETTFKILQETGFGLLQE